MIRIFELMLGDIYALTEAPPLALGSCFVQKHSGVISPQ